MAAITNNRFRPADYARNVFFVNPPAGTKIEEVQSQAYWVHLQSQIKAGDIIEVMPDDSEWRVVLLVRVSDSAGLVTAVIQRNVFGGAEPETSDGDYEIKFRGAAKWCVVRRADRHVLAERLPTREAAQQWLSGNSVLDIA